MNGWIIVSYLFNGNWGSSLMKAIIEKLFNHDCNSPHLISRSIFHPSPALLVIKHSLSTPRIRYDPRRTAICPESPLQLLRSGGIESPRSSPFLTLNCRIYLNFTYTSTSVADWCVSLSLSVLVYELGTRIDGRRRPLEVSWSLNRLYDPFLTLRYPRKLENAAITMWESAFVPTQRRVELFTTFFFMCLIDVECNSFPLLCIFVFSCFQTLSTHLKIWDIGRHVFHDNPVLYRVRK